MTEPERAPSAPDRAHDQPDHDPEAGGESACALHRVCQACGALEDGPPQPRCGRCGAARSG